MPKDAPPLPPSSSDRIPEELVTDLDHANHQFHAAKEHLESELDSYEPDREQRLEKVRQELNDAEQKVEQVHTTIQNQIKHP
jgi:hypothetical protein